MPSPSPKSVVTSMDFFDALRAIRDGNRVTKLEWANPNVYGVMHDRKLHIHRAEDNLIHPWIINDGDMAGLDWVIVSDSTPVITTTISE